MDGIEHSPAEQPRRDIESEPRYVSHGPEVKAEDVLPDVHIAFMIGTASHIGVCPNSDEYTPGCVLDMRDGCFTPLLPKHTDYMPADLSYKLHLLMESSFDRIKDAPLTGQERVILLNSLNNYFRLHIPAFPVLKSIQVLETVFG